MAAVFIGIDGKMQSVDILEAPDASIAASVRDAVMQWEFAPVTVRDRAGAWRSQGKLTFYFKPENGRVLSPEEMIATKKGLATKGAIRTSDESTAERIPDTELRRLLTAKTVALIDISERPDFRRAHRDGAMNIPMAELSARAPIELAGKEHVIVDCAGEPEALCDGAVRRLHAAGVPRVSVVK